MKPILSFDPEFLALLRYIRDRLKPPVPAAHVSSVPGRISFGFGETPPTIPAGRDVTRLTIPAAVLEDLTRINAGLVVQRWLYDRDSVPLEDITIDRIEKNDVGYAVTASVKRLETLQLWRGQTDAKAKLLGCRSVGVQRPKRVHP